MVKIAIYRKDGTYVYQKGHENQSAFQVFADSLEYVGTDMGERFCTVTVKTPYPVDFATGDYIMYRGEKFSIYDESNVLKCARSGSYGEGFVYDNLKFASRGQELINNEFLDVVLEDNQAHYTNLPEFSFFCETVDDLLDRIQANMDALTGTQNRWKIFSPDKDRSVQRGVTELEWKQYFPIPQGQSYTPPTYEITRKNVSVSDQNCWGALTLTNSDFKLNFFVVGDSIVVGAERGTLSQNFTYGKDNGLSEIGRNIDDGAAVITRLHAYGTDENIAPRYYNNRSMLPWFNCAYYSSSGVPIYNNFYFFDVSNGYTSYLDKTMFEGVVEAKDTDIANLEIYYDVSETAPIPLIAPIKICLNQEDYINGENIKEAYVGFNIRFYSDYYGEQHGVTRLIGACLIVSQQVYNALSLNTNHKLYIADGANKNDWTAWDMGGGIYVRGFDMITGNNDNMAIQKLMLPAFPLQTLKDWVIDHLDAGRGDKVNEDGSITWNGYTAFFSEDTNNPYIESVNRDALGIRPYSTTFDGNDDKDDIHPTVDKITIGDLLDAGILVPTGYYNASRDKRVDQLVAVGANITDTGIVDENGYTNDQVTNEKKKAEDYFYVTIYQLGFDIKTYIKASGADAKISFVDGMLGGYDFPIENVEAQIVSLPVTSGGTTTQVDVVCNKLKCKREKASDINMYMPKYGYNPAVGDKFVLLGINMPRTYVDVASVKLLKAALKYLSENEHSKFLYEPKIDELFMAEQHREATANSDTSLYMTIREGQLFHFTDTDLDVEVSMPINTLTIKEDGNNGIPTFEITVKNDIKATSITRNGSAASDANTSVNVNNTGISQEDVNAIKNWVDQHFLYKDRQDVAQSLINFLEGLSLGDGVYRLYRNGDVSLHDVLAHAIELSGDIHSDNFMAGLAGWQIDHNGNIEAETLHLRSALEVDELRINRQQAQEGDTIFSDNDQIIAVEEHEDQTDHSISYILTLKEKWEGYFTAQQKGNIIRGKINTLAAKEADVWPEGVDYSDPQYASSQGTDAGGNKYYTSFMFVTETHYTDPSLGVNQIRVVLFGDNEVPMTRNYPPCPLMAIARWGCINYADPSDPHYEDTLASIKRRQSFFMLSTSDGHIVKLTGVDKPILENYNYGTTLGTLPEFVKNIGNVREKYIEGRDYLYAQGVVVGDFIKVDISGAPVPELTFCGDWIDGKAEHDPITIAVWDEANQRWVQQVLTYPIPVSEYSNPNSHYIGYGIYLYNQYNPNSRRYETHQVRHNAGLWQCLQHQPVISGGVANTYPPKWNSSYWALVDGNDNLSIEFVSSKGYSFRRGHVDTIITPYLYYGNIDISNDVDAEFWNWTRVLENPTEESIRRDSGWNSQHQQQRQLHLTNADMDILWSSSNKQIFTITVTLNDGKTTRIVDNQIIS